MKADEIYAVYATACRDSWNATISAHIILPIKPWSDLDADERAGWLAVERLLAARSGNDGSGWRSLADAMGRAG